MSYLVRKVFLGLIFNSSLFAILIIGIQNSFNNSKVNLIFEETVQLPISFIVGNSFIAGSILGSLLTLNLNKKI